MGPNCLQRLSADDKSHYKEGNRELPTRLMDGNCLIFVCFDSIRPSQQFSVILGHIPVFLA